MSRAGKIVRVNPAAAIPGGEVIIECDDFDTSDLRSCLARIGGQRAHFVGLSRRRALVVVPKLDDDGETEIVMESGGEQSQPARLVVGKELADDLHSVANPAFDPDDGSLYVTRSGSRGQQFPVTIFRIDTSGQLTDFSGDITNPTAIAFDKSGTMFVTSRLDGIVYRVTHFKEAIPFVRNLGVATGLAFDRAGRMYVGDRSGTIYRVNQIGESTIFAQHEPSVSAYHLAFGPGDYLYVTGPTVSSHEVVTRFDPDGQPNVFFRGLGRPHGMAFDVDGNLYVAASLRGRRGIVRISREGEAEMAVAGMNVVGLAFSATGDMIVATNEAIYTLPLNIHGTLLG